MAYARPAAPPLPMPNAASFNTERDLRGIRPGRTLEQKQQEESRRSSFCEAVVRPGGGEEASEEIQRPLPSEDIPEEPTAPRPGATRSNPMANILQPARAPVILTSKPNFSTFYKKRAGEEQAASE